MRLSISVTDYSRPGVLETAAAAAEEAGLDTVWVPDHLLQAAPGSDPASPMLEAYTALGCLAARTERVRLGSLVSPVTYRPPAVLVKAVTTLDVLSGGRAWFGVGAGYLEQEARAFDVPLPPMPERFAALEATLELALRMWNDELPVPVSPPPATRPHPPILIGGTGERRTLRLVARYADACNLFDIPDGGATVRRKLDVLARHCEDAGRPFEAIDKTLSSRLGPDETPEAFVARIAPLGIDHVILITSGPWSDEELERVAAVADYMRNTP
jgi:alkanesulfonate monooxygenase SsuD/methylene tetrahydromethanopterin reductase-like flavin-dependent oxidoreductase (luciferase family)